MGSLNGHIQSDGNLNFTETKMLPDRVACFRVKFSLDSSSAIAVAVQPLNQVRCNWSARMPNNMDEDVIDNICSDRYIAPI